MRRSTSILLACALVGSLFATAAAAQPAAGGGVRGVRRPAGDVKPLPDFVRKWMGNKETAADLVARGLARPNARGVIRLANGQFVDYALEDTDHIVTILAEFDDPERGQIAEPDRTVDNSTYWAPNFNRRHFRDMLFADGGGSYGLPSMQDHYLALSSGRYTVEGQVSKWVHIDNPESEYGANGPDGDGSDNLNGPVYRVVRAALQATKDVNEGIDWRRRIVDQQDRYDCDLDGDFDEPDGYVDHFQLVHAGEGEEAGGGAQGGDAIWSHRWYAGQEGIGVNGPAGCKLGGYRVPGTKLWVGDYTTEPENGASGVFVHEFGHDLGLPDLYDTIGANDNSTDFWSLMSSSWPSTSEFAIGDNPYQMGPWEKLLLGWLDLAEMEAGDTGAVKLGPAEGASTAGAQALRVRLPDYLQTIEVFEPEAGDPNYYYSGSGNDLETTMRMPLAAPLGSPTALTFRTNYDIETDWDYAYVEYSNDGGSSWHTVNGNLSTTTNPNGQNQGFGITGESGGWVGGTYTIPAGATDIGFRYWTDGAVAPIGFAVDSIKLGAGPVDDATDPSAWTFDGFSQLTGGTFQRMAFHYYLFENRTYLRQDASLCGTYQFLYGNWLEKFCMANGMVVWYRDGGYEDNDVSEHPGKGQILVVDSHPWPVIQPGTGGAYWRERIQAWDAAFRVDRDRILLHTVRNDGSLRPFWWASSARRVFWDNVPGKYYNASNPFASVNTPGSGLRVRILWATADRTSMKVRVSWT
ncbi:MAG TPA: immune inhibitor A domain-containing protein [Actinomycetota bacterium]